MTWIGFIIAFVGVVVRRLCRKNNRYFLWTTRAPLEICTTGPYRFVRHPAYVGFLVLVFGLTAGLCQSWMIGLSFSVLTWFWVVRLAMEEEAAIRWSNVCDEYVAYAAKVRWALIPFVL